MCITTPSKNIRRRSIDNRRSSWSPPSQSSMAVIIDNIDIDDLVNDMSSMKEEMINMRSSPSFSTIHQERKSKKRRAGKSVSFHKEVIVRRVLHKNEYTEEEVAQTWYQTNEYSRIRRNLLSTLHLVWSGLFSEEDNKESARGLENYTDKGKIKDSVRKRRQDSTWAVLDEQDAQVDQAEAKQLNYLVYDDKAIREVYKKHARPSTDVARSAARMDAETTTSAKTQQQSRETRKSPTRTRIRSIFQHYRKVSPAPLATAA